MRSVIRIESFLLVTWIICITCAMKLDRVDFKRLFAKRDPSCQGNPCPSFKPFLCKDSPKCVPLSSVCDDIPDCEDGYDEDPKVCVAAKRPRVEQIYHYLSNEESWIIPKLFDGIDKDVVAAGLATAGSMEDLKIILGLSDEAEKNIRVALMASEEDDPRPMSALGMPDRSWPATAHLFRNLIETGFEL